MTKCATIGNPKGKKKINAEEKKKLLAEFLSDIFSITIEKSEASGDNLVTTDPPADSMVTPFSCRVYRQPGSENCVVCASAQVGEVISYAPDQGWFAIATPHRDHGR